MLWIIQWNSLCFAAGCCQNRVLNPVSRRLQMLMCEAALRIGILCSFTPTALPVNHGSGRGQLREKCSRHCPCLLLTVGTVYLAVSPSPQGQWATLVLGVPQFCFFHRYSFPRPDGALASTDLQCTRDRLGRQTVKHPCCWFLAHTPSPLLPPQKCVPSSASGISSQTG